MTGTEGKERKTIKEKVDYITFKMEEIFEPALNEIKGTLKDLSVVSKADYNNDREADRKKFEEFEARVKAVEDNYVILMSRLKPILEFWDRATSTLTKVVIALIFIGLGIVLFLQGTKFIPGVVG